jgi:anti-anti-sigma factor
METGASSLSAPPPPVAWLVAADGQKWPLTADIVTCGRASDNPLVLGDPAVSRRHARFERRPEGYFLADLSSANGTFVNGQAVSPSSPRLLQDGDQLSIGGYTSTLRLPPRPAAERPDVGEPEEHSTLNLFATAVEIVRSGDLVYARLDAKGVLNGETIQPLMGACNWAIERQVIRVMITAADLDYIDSAGIGGLVGLQRHLTQLGGGLALVNPPLGVRQIIELVNLSTYLPMYVDERQAAAAASAART